MLSFTSSATRHRFPRTAVVGIAIFLAYLIAVGLIHLDGARAAREGQTPLFTDFTSLYGASLLLQREPASNLYLPRPNHEANLAAAQAVYDGQLTDAQARQIGFHPWMYPPIFMLFAWPLAGLSYAFAQAAWLLASGGIFIAAMQRILPGRLAWAAALAAPPVFFNLMYGQTGFLTAGFIGLGLALLGRRPWLAGLFIGLASFKPHFGVLIPFALMAGAHWRAFAAASLTVLGLVLVSAVGFGVDVWYGFIGSLMNSLGGFATGSFKWKAMSSTFGLFYSLGLKVMLASYVQALTALACVLLVVWSWRRRDFANATNAALLPLRCAILCAATLLAAPMVYLYDLVLIVPAAAWLWCDMQTRGAQRWELPLLVGCLAAMLGLREFAWAAGVQPGAALVAVILWLAVRRFERAAASA
jgi:hypothetical protein